MLPYSVQREIKSIALPYPVQHPQGMLVTNIFNTPRTPAIAVCCCHNTTWHFPNAGFRRQEMSMHVTAGSAYQLSI
jgi:hypothetical protein